MEFPVEVRVVPGKKETRIVGEQDGVLRVEVAAKPEHNQANLEIVRFFSKIAGRKVRIVNGLRSKRKVIG